MNDLAKAFVDRLRTIAGSAASSHAAIALVAAAALTLCALTATADDDRADREQQAGQSDDAEQADGDGDRRQQGRVRGSASPYGAPPEDWVMPLSDAQIDLILDVLDDMQPEGVTSLRDMREENPDRFESIINRIAPQTLHDAYLREHDPEAFELRTREHQFALEAMHLGWRARSAEDPEQRESAREELEDVLTSQFEVRMQLVEHEMAQLERRLRMLRGELESQKMQRERFVERRLEHILDGPPRSRRSSGDAEDDDERLD